MTNQLNIGSIFGATITTDDIEKTAQPYIVDLNYKLHSFHKISKELATTMNAIAHLGAKCLILRPESKPYPWIRFIESKKFKNYKAMTTYGWHSLEINVQKVDSIPKMLNNSVFKIIGKPHDLGMSKSIRAMQVIGNAEEVLYLTQLPSDGSRPDLPEASTFIDQIFIVPLGSPNMDQTRSWYLKNFTNISKGIEARNIKLKLITNALKISEKTKLSICTIRLPGKGSIEIDDYPKEASMRPRNLNSLPPGIASVSFYVNSLDLVKVPFVSPPKIISEEPYNGRKVGVIIGDASEIIELIENK